MEDQKQNISEEKYDKLDMIETVYVITTLFSIVALMFLVLVTIPEIMEIIQGRYYGDITYKYASIGLIFLLVLIEILGLIGIWNYNRKHS